MFEHEISFVNRCGAWSCAISTACIKDCVQLSPMKTSLENIARPKLLRRPDLNFGHFSPAITIQIISSDTILLTYSTIYDFDEIS